MAKSEGCWRRGKVLNRYLSNIEEEDVKRFSTGRSATWVVGFAFIVGACGGNEDAEPSTDTALGVPPAAAEAAAPGYQEFLREMTNHHHG